MGRRHIGTGSEPPEYPLTSHISHNYTGKIHKLAARSCSDASQVTMVKFQLECDFANTVIFRLKISFNLIIYHLNIVL